MRCLFILAAFSSIPAFAQDPLSLRKAVELALHQNKTLLVSQYSINAAETHVRQARASLLPKVDYTESFTRSDNPVFVFGSLLTQHQFRQNNFALGSLNRPAFLNNFQSNITASQILFDAGRTRFQVRSASSFKDMAQQDDRQTRTQTIFNVTKAYLDAVLSGEALAAAAKTVESAEADLVHAEQVRQVGMSTDADVLSIRVHLAGVRQQKIKREADLVIAQATLNDAMGAALEVPHQLTTAMKRVDLPVSTLQDLEKTALQKRPEQLKLNYSTNAATSQLAAAKTSLLPTVSVRGVFEADRQDFISHGGANWTAGVALNWNLFNGGNDKSHIQEATQALLQTHAEQDRISSSVRLDVRRAFENLRSADQQIAVSQSAVAEAEESLRIIQNRYQAGLSTVTDLLRTESALLESRTIYLAALHDQRLAAVILDAATGTLTVDSPALQE